MAARHHRGGGGAILPAGALDPDEIHTPGIYVERMVQIPADGVFRMAGQQQAPAAEDTDGAVAAGGRRRLSREDMAHVIGQRLRPGAVVNLGIGIPTLASSYVRPGDDVTFTSENGVIGYGRLAAPAEGDPDIRNAVGQLVTLNPGGTFVHHADRSRYPQRRLT
jgi:3-oxoacid CoA-transferase